MWVECRVILLCGWSTFITLYEGSKELSHCVGVVQNYHIVLVQCRVITLCGCSAELPHFVGAVQSTTLCGWREVITLCRWSAELSYYVGGVQSYHILWVESSYHIV